METFSDFVDGIIARFGLDDSSLVAAPEGGERVFLATPVAELVVDYVHNHSTEQLQYLNKTMASAESMKWLASLSETNIRLATLITIAVASETILRYYQLSPVVVIALRTTAN